MTPPDDDRDPTDLGLAASVPRGTTLRELREVPAGELVARLAGFGVTITPEQLDRMDASARAEEAERERREREQAAADRVRQLVSYGMPTKDLDAFAAAALVASEARGAVDRFVARHAKERAHSVLVLIGAPGSGKTCAAAWWLTMRSPKHPHVETAPPLFMTAGRIARTSSFDDAKLTRIELAEKLVIDDLGIEYSDDKGSFASKLDQLLDARYEHLLPTIITTNLAHEQMRTRLGPRVLSRFAETAHVATVAGNFRGRK
jgi:DNA replication protein DnaC